MYKYVHTFNYFKGMYIHKLKFANFYKCILV